MTLLEELAAAIGEGNVLVDADQMATYEVDWTGRFRGKAEAVARPSNSVEVAAVLAACRTAGASVVPQGGNTGLVGGAVPRDGSVVLTTGAMNAIEVDGRQLLAGAGVALSAAQQGAKSLGARLAIDIASRGSATVGGLLATNARGAHAFRFGPMESQVAGVEAVLADGVIVDDLAGRDGWKARLAGSEGTLAVITRLVLNLHPIPDSTTTAMMGFESIEAAVGAFDLLDKDQLEAAEIMTGRSIRLVSDYLGKRAPVDEPVVVLLEATGPASLEILEAAIDHASAAVVSQDASDRKRLWQWRDSHTEAIALLGVPHKLDVRIAPSLLDDLIDRMEPLGAEVYVFGHLGDGGTHINALGPEPADKAFDAEVLRLVAELGGSVVGEHGVGSVKPDWLALSESWDSIEAMRVAKNSLDPLGLLNPGVRVPAA